MLQRHHEKLCVFSFPVEELQTKNNFTLGFDLVVDTDNDCDELLEVTFIFEGSDAIDENDAGVQIEYRYHKSDKFTFSLSDIIDHPESPKSVKELFNNPDELANLDKAIVPYVDAIFEGNLFLTDVSKEDMFETMAVEFDIELMEEEIVAPFYVQIFEHS